jgi:sugar lactone lactonase YvrE
VKKIGLLLGLVLVPVAAYLSFWPVPIDPVAWDAPPAPAVVPNQKLAAVKILAPAVPGPEAVAVDGAGNLFVTASDGRIRRVSADGAEVETLAETGGRPLGIKIDERGGLVVADATKGLLRVDPYGALEKLADSFEGKPLGFADDVAIGPDGTIYLSDASQRWGLADHGSEMDVLEHRGTGRVFAYRDGKLDKILDGLQFANGLAIGGGGDFLLVNETGGYRVLRHWLRGEKQGRTEPFCENLPGFPDNITASPRGGLYWVALFSPRLGTVDKLSGWPRLRKAAMRLPQALRPKPIKKAFVVGLDDTGKIVHDLQADGPDAYAPITSAVEHAGTLYLGSLQHAGIATLPVP